MRKALLILSQAIPVPIRHRSVIGLSGILMLLGAITAFGTVSVTTTYPKELYDVIERLDAPPLGSEKNDSAPTVVLREARIRSGETIASLFARIGISDSDALAFLQGSRETAILFQQMVPGKLISAGIRVNGELESLDFPLNSSNSSLKVRRTGGGFAASTDPVPYEKILRLQSASVRHSLFGAADDAGIPESVATQLADIFGGDIDFHRDLRKGDQFSVVYESESHLGKPIRSGRILAAELINDGKNYRAFWFDDKNGVEGYYTEDGHSIKKAFLRSPLEFSRITSGFSSARYHPVLQEIRAHRGIDYGAPTGTRVRATGDGVIEFAGNQGGYGKLVMIRHTGGRVTAYGHLSGFTPSLRKGTRVSQGETIGFVGATGLATAPHLHYEFRVAGVHRNPLAMTLPHTPPLSQARLPVFRAHTAELMTQLDTLRGTQLVMLD